MLWSVRGDFLSRYWNHSSKGRTSASFGVGLCNALFGIENIALRHWTHKS
jgi:hypothetical protein